METGKSQNPPVGHDIDLLYARYSDMVYRLALVRTRNASDAEDVLQEVFLRYLKNEPVFETEEHQKAWLITVTINCTKTLLSTAYRRHSLPMETLLDAGTEDTYPDTTVYEAVMKLPSKYRTAIHLFYYEEYSIKEIADVMHASETAVKTWLRRARLKLKDELKEEFEDVSE